MNIKHENSSADDYIALADDYLSSVLLSLESADSGSEHTKVTVRVETLKIHKDLV